MHPCQVEPRHDVHYLTVLAHPLFRARRFVSLVRLAGKVGADAEDAVGGKASNLVAVL